MQQITSQRQRDKNPISFVKVKSIKSDRLSEVLKVIAMWLKIKADFS